MRGDLFAAGLTLAQTSTEVTFRTIEWAFPETAGGRLVAATLALIAIVSTVRIAVVEARTVGVASAWLATLRLATLATLGVIAFDPHERRQRDVTEPSRVAVLVDTSLSMAEPVRVSKEDVPTRSEAVADVLLGTEAAGRSLAGSLSSVHRPELYTFDGGLTAHGTMTPEPTLPDTDDGDADPDRPDATAEDAARLSAALTPGGARTGLGDALTELLRTAGGPTLAGVIVVSDGRTNSGVGVDAAVAAATGGRREIPVATVGVGDTRRRPDVTIADVRAPREVRFSPASERQDPFDVTAFVTARADTVATGTVTAVLSRRPEGTDAETASDLERRDIEVGTDGVPKQVDFAVEPDGSGRFVYTVRIEPRGGLEDFDPEDNAAEVTVDVIERNTAVLVIAGGPTRDYRFALPLLDRSPTFDVDVWLQTVRPGDAGAVSQDADDLLTEFPPSFPVRPDADAFGEDSSRPRDYDLVIAFDADWSAVGVDGQRRLATWVAEERGGLILAAGDIHQTRLGAPDQARPQVLDLYPVVPAPPRSLTAAPPVADRSWPVTLTESGRRARFMDPRADGPGDEDDVDGPAWPRLYRAVPTVGIKSLATVYATLDDPTTAGREAVVVAAQPFGGGRVLYLGSPETWRLRSRGSGRFERFWIGMAGDAAQGRRRRSAGGLILLDRRDYDVGQTAVVRVERARGGGEDRAAPVLFAFGPDGEPVSSTGIVMKADRLNTRQFVADVPLATPGRYTFRVETGSGPMLTANAEAVLPAIERQDVRLDEGLLRRLAERTGSRYCTLDEAADVLPALFAESAARVVRLDEGRSSLWDRGWVLALLASLLSAEWLSRKLLKLA